MASFAGETWVESGLVGISPLHWAVCLGCREGERGRRKGGGERGVQRQSAMVKTGRRRPPTHIPSPQPNNRNHQAPIHCTPNPFTTLLPTLLYSPHPPTPSPSPSCHPKGSASTPGRIPEFLRPKVLRGSALGRPWEWRGSGARTPPPAQAPTPLTPTPATHRAASPVASPPTAASAAVVAAAELGGLCGPWGGEGQDAEDGGWGCGAEG